MGIEGVSVRDPGIPAYKEAGPNMKDRDPMVLAANPFNCNFAF